MSEEKTDDVFEWPHKKPYERLLKINVRLGQRIGRYRKRWRENKKLLKTCQKRVTYLEAEVSKAWAQERKLEANLVTQVRRSRDCETAYREKAYEVCRLAEVNQTLRESIENAMKGPLLIYLEGNEP